MVFGKLFGGGDRKRRQEAEEAENFRRGLEAPMRALLDLIHEMPLDGPAKMLLRQRIIQRDKGELERTLQNVILPKLDPAWQARLKDIGKTEAWMTLPELAKTPMCERKDTDRAHVLDLGRFRIPPEQSQSGQGGYVSVIFGGDGHLLTVAPTGAGKGQAFVIRNLYNYEGPAVVLDPKGELYRETGWRRDWYGKVFKWAPFEEDSDCFNPMDMLAPLPNGDESVIWDNARRLADLMIEPMGKEPFWDNAAKDLLTALIFYVYRTYPQKQRNIREVTRLLALSRERQAALVRTLTESEDERLQELGNTLLDQPDNVRMSITQTLRTQLDVWRTEGVVRATRGTTHDMHPHTIAQDDYMRWFLHEQGAEDPPGYWPQKDGTAISGDAHTVYIVIPPEQISTYRSVLRVILGMMMQGVMEFRRYLEADADETKTPLPKGQWPFLFVLDEMPQLGYMQIVEDAVSIARGANIRLWMIAQDLSQLRNVYPRWETLVANAKAQMYFRPNDLGTAQYISAQLGEYKDIWGNRASLAPPEELMGETFRDEVVIRFQGHKPIRAMIPTFWSTSEKAKAMVARERPQLGEPDRESEPWPVDGLTLDELNAQNEAMRKQVPEPQSKPLPSGSGDRPEPTKNTGDCMEDALSGKSTSEAEDRTEDGLPRPPRLE